MSIIKTLMENGADKHWGQTMREALKDAKRYLKTDFKAHVGRDKNSSDHSTVHAFSDPSDLNLSGEFSTATTLNVIGASALIWR